MVSGSVAALLQECPGGRSVADFITGHPVTATESERPNSSILALRLAEREAEEQSERERREDREVGIPELAAAAPVVRRRPCGDRLLSQTVTSPRLLRPAS